MRSSPEFSDILVENKPLPGKKPNARIRISIIAQVPTPKRISRTRTFTLHTLPPLNTHLFSTHLQSLNPTTLNYVVVNSSFLYYSYRLYLLFPNKLRVQLHYRTSGVLNVFKKHKLFTGCQLHYHTNPTRD